MASAIVLTMPRLRRSRAVTGWGYCLLLISLISANPGRASDSPCYPAFEELAYSRHLNGLAVGPGQVWMGSVSGGVLRLDTDTLAIERYTRVSACLPSNFVNSIYLGPQGIARDPVTGDVWVATDAGLGRLPGDGSSGGIFLTYDTSNSPLTNDLISAVAVDGSGGVWVGTFDAGLFHFDGASEWTHYHGGNSGLSDPFVTSLVIDSSGALWVGVWGDGVDRFDGVRWQNFSPRNTYPPNPGCTGFCPELLGCPPDDLGFVSFFVDVLAADPVTGDVWFGNEDDNPGCRAEGLTRFDGSGFSTFTAQNSGLLSNRFETAAVDAAGTVWAGTLNGMNLFSDGRWSTNPDLRARALAVLDGDMWIAGGDELHRFDGERAVPIELGGLVDGVEDIAFDPATGNPWFATRQGLQHYDGSTFETFDATGPLPVNTTRAVLFDSGGDLWVGTQPGGIARRSGLSWTTYHPSTSPGLCCSTIDTLHEAANGDVWAAWSLGGVSFFDGVTWTNVPAAAGGLPSTYVYDITSGPNGELWFATQAGAARLQEGSWTVFTMADGLIDDRIRSVLLEPNGTVWMGTKQGLSRLSGGTFTNFPLGGDMVTSLERDASGTVRAGLRNGGVVGFAGDTPYSLRYADGLMSDRVTSLAGARNGSQWIGTEQGVSIHALPEPSSAALHTSTLLALALITTTARYRNGKHITPSDERECRQNKSGFREV